MKTELLKIMVVAQDGKKSDWITVGLYDDPDHPRRKYCYRECSPCTIWFDDAQNLQDVLSYLWKNVIDASGIVERGYSIIVEKA